MTILTNWESSEFLKIERDYWNGTKTEKSFSKIKILTNRKNKAQTANNAYKKLLNWTK
jgi:hypothetical protein